MGRVANPNFAVLAEVPLQNGIEADFTVSAFDEAAGHATKVDFLQWSATIFAGAHVHLDVVAVANDSQAFVDRSDWGVFVLDADRAIVSPLSSLRTTWRTVQIVRKRSNRIGGGQFGLGLHRRLDVIVGCFVGPLLVVPGSGVVDILLRDSVRVRC